MIPFNISYALFALFLIYTFLIIFFIYILICLYALYALFALFLILFAFKSSNKEYFLYFFLLDLNFLEATITISCTYAV